MEWLTDVADVKLQGIRPLMNNFIKDFFSLKIDYLQQEVHRTAQFSFPCKDNDHTGVSTKLG